MLRYRKRIMTWVMTIVLLTGLIAADNRSPVYSKAETESQTQIQPQGETTDPEATIPSSGEDQVRGGDPQTNPPDSNDVTQYVNITLDRFCLAQRNSNENIENGEPKYIPKEGGDIVKDGKPVPNPPELKKEDDFLLYYKWSVSGEHMDQITDKTYFKIQLPNQKILASNKKVEGKISTLGGSGSLGSYVLENGVVTATFEGDFSNMDYLEGGFFEFWAYAVKDTESLPIVIDQNASSQIEITINPKPPATPGGYNPGKFEDKEFKEKVLKSAWQGKDMEVEEVISYTVALNTDQLWSKYKSDTIEQRKNMIIYDKLPEGLELTDWKGEEVIIQVPIYFPAVYQEANSTTGTNVGDLTGGLSRNLWYSGSKTIYRTSNAVDNSPFQNKSVFYKPDDSVPGGINWEAFLTEFDQQPAYTIGKWGKRGIAINMGDLPYQELTYSDLFGGKDKLEEEIDKLQTHPNESYRINEKQAAAMKAFYAADKQYIPAYRVVFYAEAVAGGPTYKNTINAKWQNQSEIPHTSWYAIFEGNAGVGYGSEKVNIKVVKTWNRTAPTTGTVKLKLIENGVTTVAEHDLSGPAWEHIFMNFPKKKNHKNIIYSIEEQKIDGYKMTVHDSQTSEDGKTITIHITNTETTDIKVKKIWKGNAPGDILPGVNVLLLKSGSSDTVGNLLLTAGVDGKWEGYFEDVLKYDKSGQPIEYTVKEVPVPGYKREALQGNMTDGFIITNTKEASDPPTPPTPIPPGPTPPTPPVPIPPPDIPIIVPPDIEEEKIIEEFELDDDDIARSNKEEDEEILDDIPKVNKDVPKTHDFLMNGAANPLAVSTLLMMGYGVKKLLAKKKKK